MSRAQPTTASSEDGRGHKPRQAGSLYRREEASEWILPRPPEGTSPTSCNLDISPLTPALTSSLQNGKRTDLFCFKLSSLWQFVEVSYDRNGNRGTEVPNTRSQGQDESPSAQARVQLPAQRSTEGPYRVRGAAGSLALYAIPAGIFSPRKAFSNHCFPDSGSGVQTKLGGPCR